MNSQLLHRPGKFFIALSLLVPLLVGCTSSQAVEAPAYRGAATQASFSDAQLDSLLAPIALYPDTVLSHVLIASTYPLEVVEAERWARNNSRYKGEDAVNAVDNKDWDPSVKALVAFPDLLKRMSEDLDWTQQLGDAFLANEERVMDSIQKLRNRAYDSGSLDKVEHVRVIREERTIVIEPSVERVVYVPAYDTRVVYGHWWWADYPPVYWHYPSSYVFVSGFYWGPRVYLGPRFYFSACHWHQRRVVVVDHHHHHRFYDSRSIVRHSNARHWHHNPVHRRGVAYYDNPTRERFNSPRESYRESREYRSNLRDNNRNNNYIAPNRARDQRQGRDEQFQQRLERTQAGPMGGNDARARIYNRDDQRQIQGDQPRAEQFRERMNNRAERRLQEQPGIQGQERPSRQEQPSRQDAGQTESRQPEYRARPSQQGNEMRQRMYSTEERNRQQQNTVRPAPEPSYQSPPRERLERRESTERMETQRPQAVDRNPSRFQHAERRDNQGINRGGDDRASMRGERQR